jgi:hypothetical protein
MKSLIARLEKLEMALRPLRMSLTIIYVCDTPGAWCGEAEYPTLEAARKANPDSSMTIEVVDIETVRILQAILRGEGRESQL